MELVWYQIVFIVISFFLVVVCFLMGATSYLVDKKRPAKYVLGFLVAVGLMLAAMYAPNIAAMIEQKCISLLNQH